MSAGVKSKNRLPWVTPKPLCESAALELLAESVRTGQYSNDGPCVRSTAAYLESHLQLPASKRVVMAASGTAALHSLVAAFDILRGGRPLTWVTQAATFPSSVLGPLRDRCQVLDNDAVAFGPSFAALEAEKATFDGIIVTNLFGMACDVAAYTAWAALNGKLCVFDNAATPMTFWNGENLCALGDGAIISLHETKPLGRGEGGAVICSVELAAAVHRAQNFGFVLGTPVRTPHHHASNWRMSDIAAAFIQARLQLLTPTMYETANAIIRAVDAVLQTDAVKPYVQWIVPLLVRVTRVFPSCLLLATSVPVDVHAFGAATGIEARQYYVPLADADAAPVAWQWYTHCVCLPFDYMAVTSDGAVAAVLALIQWVKTAMSAKTGVVHSCSG